MRYGWMLILAGFLPAVASAEDKAFTLEAPAALVDSGLLKYIVPRFALKTSIRVTVVGENGDAVLGSRGVAVFEGPEAIWSLALNDDPDAARFADWLRSDVGRGAVDAFRVDGAAMFSSSIEKEVVEVEVSFDGDAAKGEDLSLSKCGRCHVVNDQNRMDAIGSTPSFAVLRTFEDWDARFQNFYVLKPHAAFTQIADVTDPFAPTRPPPIVPIKLTLDDLENIMAFVSVVAPADLGRPVQSR